MSNNFYNNKPLYFLFRLIIINLVLLINFRFLLNLFYTIFPPSDYIVTLVSIIILVLVSKYMLQVSYNFREFKSDINNLNITFKENFNFSLKVMFLVGIFLLLTRKVSILLNLMIVEEYDPGILTTDILIGAIIFSPFIEELFFRRSLYIFITNNINSKVININKYIFLVYSTIAFSSLHFSSINKFISVIPLGIGLSIIYMYTRNFLYPYIMHLIYNVLVMIEIPKLDLYICNKLNISQNEILVFSSFIHFTIIIFIVLIVFNIICKFTK